MSGASGSENESTAGPSEVSLSTELASRLKDERARDSVLMNVQTCRAAGKRSARILKIKTAARDAARDAAFKAGEGYDETEAILVVDPEECNSYEFEDENDTLAYPIELSEKSLPTDDQAAVAAGELPNLLALDEFVQKCLCTEIVDVPDSRLF